MNCPKCSATEMMQETVEDVTIDRCPSCHGIWLDMLELEKLLATDPRPLLEEDRVFEAAPNVAGPRINCPRCQGTYLLKLNSREHPGTIVDSCTVCYGTWLDAGELARLANVHLRDRLRMLFRTRR